MSKHKFKQLIRFLQERNLYWKFLYNYKHHKKTHDYLWENRRNKVFTDDVEYKICEYIQTAFAWNNTKEGSDFWYSKYIEAYG